MKPESDLAATAVDWVARRDAGLSGPERARLQAWLAADPEHRAAFARADDQRTEVDWALHVGAVDEVLAGLEDRANRRRIRRRGLAAVGAAALIIFGALAWQRTPAPLASPVVSNLASVKIVEPRRMTLPDGSTAELHDGADIAVDFSGAFRRVTLRRGAAHFQVAHDTAHPFVVSSGGVDVRAVGTGFSVQLDSKNVEVVVTEGRVAVARSPGPASGSAAPTRDRLSPPVLLDAGYGVSAAIGSAVELDRPFELLPTAALRERLAWRVPRLEFAGTPLSEVVAVMNRHNRMQFVLADADLGGLQLSGIVGADRIEALQEMLETGFPIRAERKGDRIVLRRVR